MYRQGKEMQVLEKIIDLLAAGSSIPEQLLDHPLKGVWRGCRELHIAPDWLLVYHIENDTVYLDRTGSHAELFKR
jgi:mRNA interferase YafQ